MSCDTQAMPCWPRSCHEVTIHLDLCSSTIRLSGEQLHHTSHLLRLALTASASVTAASTAAAGTCWGSEPDAPESQALLCTAWAAGSGSAGISAASAAASALEPWFCRIWGLIRKSGCGCCVGLGGTLLGC